jgi:hypothetical protein
VPEGADPVGYILDRVIIRSGSIELIWRDNESDRTHHL